jgi:hypothetical protein
METFETDDGETVVELSYSELKEYAEVDILRGDFCPNGCVDELEKDESKTTCQSCGVEYILKSR